MIDPFFARPRLTFRAGGMQVLRHIIPVCVVLVCAVLLWDRIATMDLDRVATTIRDVTAAQWALAALASWGSFQAIGRYDATWHRILATGVPARQARRSGMLAIAIAQTLGFGAASGSLVRWRALPQLSLWQATRISFAVTLTFTAFWALYALIAVWWLGFGQILQFPALVLLLAAIVVLGDMARRRWAPGLARPDALTLLGWTAVDMGLAALALYLLLPAGTGLPFVTLAAAYVMALGAGLISNAPGGAGAFELTMLGVVTLTAPEPLLGAILAFRIVYYLVPAGIALIVLARPIAARFPDRRHPAAWQLARQSGTLRRVGKHDLFIGSLPCVAATLGPIPRVARCATTFATLRRQSLLRMQIPALYNCDRRSACVARGAGWHVRRTAMEAIITPAAWHTEGRARQTLRRKLRQAAAAGVSVRAASGPLPIEDMTRIARAWALSHGGEMGFSMGRFCPEYVAKQRIFLIHNDQQISGFITFHTAMDGWTLDLIRHDDTLPEGAIHVAIVTAIAQARAEDVPQLSLAAVPDPRHTPAFWSDRRAGLIQFKRSFAPDWQPRYHAAPTETGFWISGMIIGFAIHRPLANLPWKMVRNLRKSGPAPRLAIEVSPKT